MERGLQGRYQTQQFNGENVNAFIPFPLPPRPELVITSQLQQKLDDAVFALGELNAVSGMVPDVNIILYMFVRKEAVLSSMIEGTQSSLSDLLTYECNDVPGVPLEDVREVCQYVDALQYSVEKLNIDLPLSMRLLRQVHARLLAHGRGSDKDPGEFRKSQNWIGGTRPGNAFYVPPPPGEMMQCLSDLERFWHTEDNGHSALILAALSHFQFETIHPFLDGNGRVGRLLITMILRDHGLLDKPLLYISLYFKQHRQAYYDFLNATRTHGDFERWIDFFADAVLASAKNATQVIAILTSLFAEDRAAISKSGKRARSAIKVFDAMRTMPIASVQDIKGKTSLTDATVNASLKLLQTLDIVNETTGRAHSRRFVYRRYLDILNADFTL